MASNSQCMIMPTSNGERYQTRIAACACSGRPTPAATHKTHMQERSRAERPSQSGARVGHARDNMVIICITHSCFFFASAAKARTLVESTCLIMCVWSDVRTFSQSAEMSFNLLIISLAVSWQTNGRSRKRPCPTVVSRLVIAVHNLSAIPFATFMAASFSFCTPRFAAASSRSRASRSFLDSASFFLSFLIFDFLSFLLFRFLSFLLFFFLFAAAGRT